MSVDQINLISVKLIAIKKGAFAGLAITHLDLRGNNIHLEEEGAFAGLEDLEQLDLRSNGITNFPGKVFMGLEGLKKLDLRKNLIHTLSPGQFDGLSSLQKLFLHENSIYRIEQDAFKGMVLLKDLYLHKNKLEGLESALVFDDLHAMNDLDMDMNPMTSKKKCPGKTAKKKQKVGKMKKEVEYCCCVDGKAMAAEHKKEEEAEAKADAEFEAGMDSGSSGGKKKHASHEIIKMSTSSYNLFLVVLVAQFGVIGCLGYQLMFGAKGSYKVDEGDDCAA
jgi:Leucine-rich repeat (LRR) protein